jgi:hypothetical protein
MKVARLSAVLTGRLYPPEIPLVLISLRGLDDARAIVWPEELSQVLCRVFTVVYLEQTMCLGCIVFQPFCIIIIIIIIIIIVSSSSNIISIISIHRQSI